MPSILGHNYVGGARSAEIAALEAF
ncbi:hypothetical protein, partial [Pseudomonas aeruginosa]